MASDFSIAQFRFLERLLIVHGHWCYKRIALMVHNLNAMLQNVYFDISKNILSAKNFQRLLRAVRSYPELVLVLLIFRLIHLPPA